MERGGLGSVRERARVPTRMHQHVWIVISGVLSATCVAGAACVLAARRACAWYLARRRGVATRSDTLPMVAEVPAVAVIDAL